MQQVKHNELKKHKSQYTTAIERLDNEIAAQDEKRQMHALMYKEVTAQLEQEEASMRQEILKFESEIKTVKTESSQTEQALANKEKSSQYAEVNAFFAQEVPNEYIAQIKDCFNELNQSSDYKLTLFEEKKKLNQLEYEYSQKFSQCQEMCCNETSASAKTTTKASASNFLMLDEAYSWVTTEVPDVPAATWFLLSGAQVTPVPILSSIVSQRELMLKQELDEQFRPKKQALEQISKKQSDLLQALKEKTQDKLEEQRQLDYQLSQIIVQLQDSKEI